jgi:hypothetical protein
MNKNLKIALIIAGIIAIIYFWNKKNTDESEKSEFLGGLFSKKGSKRWADGLAAKFCKLRDILKRLSIENSANVANGMATPMNSVAYYWKVEAEMQSIVNQLAVYGYGISISSCKAVPNGSNKIYKPGDQLGKDCLCKDKTTWAPECCKAAK